MRRLAGLLLAACATVPEPEVSTLLRKAEEAAMAPDWPVVLGALEEASLLAPDDPDVALRLAATLLEAYGEVDRARFLFERVRPQNPARALHGLGRCALWEGAEAAALRLFRASLKVQTTAACARDLALLLLGSGANAEEALDLVEDSRAALRSRLLLAAAGRRKAPARLPQEWSYGLERARLAAPQKARTEVEAYLNRACANPSARSKMEKVLAGDPALKRNLGARPKVKE